jgi:hypothetical protein
MAEEEKKGRQEDNKTRDKKTTGRLVVAHEDRVAGA